MKVISFFFLSTFLIFSPFLSYASVDTAIPVYSQNDENIDMTSSSGDKYITADMSRTMEEMLIFFEENDLIITATKQPQTVADAPAIATIITAKEIRNMGARDIVDVLNRIAGIHVTKGYYGREEIEIRGIRTANSEKIKLLIDGHSVNWLMSGDAMYSFDSLSVENIKRIEVIRGPGSALYGSNAFSAVVNVITKEGKDIEGASLLAGRGSFNTEKLNFQAGKNYGDFEFALALDFFKTEGDELKVESDANGQPGETHDAEKKYDIALNMAYKDFSFHSKYMKKKRDDYIGPFYSAETDETEIDIEHYFAEIAYNKRLFKQTNVNIKAYMDRVDFDAYWEAQPEGFAGGLYPDGLIGNPTAREKTTGSELQIDQELFENNLMTIGAVRERREQYDVGHKANFFTFTTIVEVPSWNQEKIRNTWAAYLQDVWDITDDINLTLGVRHDHYSDFGGTTNPRIGFVWEFADKWDLKLLYGTAFRAPSFEELYNTKDVTPIGNPDLDPEKIRTYEASLGHSYKKKGSIRLTLFNNMFRDKIDKVASKFQNTGGAEVSGIEVEWKMNISDAFNTYLNYTYQEAEDEKTGDRIPDIASHKGNLGLNVSLSQYVNVNTNIYLSGKRPRVSGDTRSSASAYELVDLTVIGKEFIENIEIRGSVHNLFDREYEDPAPAGTVTNDFPREGRSVMLEAMYKF